jgi:hypothetical protein
VLKEESEWGVTYTKITEYLKEAYTNMVLKLKYVSSDP